MTDKKRLIEVDFPLEQVSLDSVHEKNVRHGHISTLHIWPARRPLAASRAALIATLLPDPGEQEERKEIYRRLAGEVVETIEQKKIGGRTVEKRKRETRGGILHWGRESGPDLEWFREKIQAAYGGRAPKVLDPFAGGGAIPLEAMRLGCEVTAIDINPVAWFILKCTLEYPQKLAGQSRPLPDFVLKDREFMESFLKAKGFKASALKRQLAKLGLDQDGQQAEPELIAHNPLLEADLAWQVRAWGRLVLAAVRKKLAHRYPTYAEFEALEPGGKPFEPRPLSWIEPDEKGDTSVAPLNAGFDKTYLEDPRNPRWLAKPTVAYLWARTVRCKGCRASIPLLRTKWLARKDNKRILLTMTPNPDRTGVVFGLERNTPQVGGNAAQRREHDKRHGAGTMTRSGAHCPCCPTIMSGEDIRLEGKAGRLGAVVTTVVVDSPTGKEYRAPAEIEMESAVVALGLIDNAFSEVPFFVPNEPISPDRPSPNTRGASGLPRYGIDTWGKLHTDRQLLALGELASATRNLHENPEFSKLNALWKESIYALLVAGFDKSLTNSTNICSWNANTNSVRHTFARFALPMVWDFVELSPLTNTGGSYANSVDWVAAAVEFASVAAAHSPASQVILQSSTTFSTAQVDCIITDPPYYDAIPYSDLMDFYHVWLRRLFHGVFREAEEAFSNPLGPKWNHSDNDGELVDQPSRFYSKQRESKSAYEFGMAAVFSRCHAVLTQNGRLVIVFANKQASAWETLATALIKAGFVVDGSWPIQTERASRSNALAAAALASSVWLVCRKRPATRPGWDNAVLADMRERIHAQLRAFWDSGIRGPDFVWAATGPALEAFSKYPIVKKADEPNAQMTVSEFLREVRRLVVDFVVGRVLTRGEATEMAASLDDLTTYYLLHRNDFGLDEAPIGACILYALSCNLSDGELADRFDILSRTGGTLFDQNDAAGSEPDEDADEEEVEEAGGGKGNKVKLKPWNQRRSKSLGYESPGGRPIALIDQVHRLMYFWRSGEEAKVDDYLETRGLKRNALFAQLLQALIELAPQPSEERSILESLSNHIVSRGGIAAPRQIGMEV